jgi:hypothetical protein
VALSRSTQERGLMSLFHLSAPGSYSLTFRLPATPYRSHGRFVPFVSFCKSFLFAFLNPVDSVHSV